MDINGEYINDFTTNALACLLELQSGSDFEDRAEDLNMSEKGVIDYASEAIVRMKTECAAFEKEGRDLWEKMGLSDEQAGYDFILCRLGAGVDFRDRKTDADDSIAEKLCELAKRAPYLEGVYTGDDGKVYLM